MSSKSLVEKAVEISRLMQLSTALGGAAEVAEDGEVFLTTSNRTRIRLGCSIPAAVSFTAPLAGHLGVVYGKGQDRNTRNFVWQRTS